MNAAKMVFHFDNPIEFLNAQFRERQSANPRFSLRAWARQMGYRNPSLLFQVLKGERRLKMDLAKRLAADLSLTGKSLRYFELIVLNGLCQSEAERRVFLSMITKLRPKNLRGLNHLATDVFAVTADWYHGAILAMVEVSEFKLDSAWIQKHLGGTVDKKTIQGAVERLVRLGFIIQRADGTLARTRTQGLVPIVDEAVADEAINKYHSQMLEKAKLVADHASDGEVRLQSATFSVAKSDLPRVERILAEAQRQILELAGRGGGDRVYQLNSQLFRLSTPKKASASAPAEGKKTSSPATK